MFPSLLQCPRYLSQADVHNDFEPWKNVGSTLKEKIQNMEDIWTILCLLSLANNEEFVFSESELEMEHRHLTFWRDLSIQYLQPLGKMRPASLPQNTVPFLCRKATHFCETVRGRKKRSFWWHSALFLVLAHYCPQWLQDERKTYLPLRWNGCWLHCLSGGNIFFCNYNPSSLSAMKLSISRIFQDSLLSNMKYIPYSFPEKLLVIKIHYCALLMLKKVCWKLANSHSLPPFLPSISSVVTDPNKCIVPWSRENKIILNW